MKPRLLALLVAAGSCVVFLASGSRHLEFLLPGGLPLGNLIAAALMGSVALCAVALSMPGTLARHACRGAVLVAAAWLPVSVGLAGNLALNFSSGNGALWAGFTLATTSAVLGALAFAGIQRLHCYFRRRTSTSAD